MMGELSFAARVNIRQGIQLAPTSRSPLSSMPDEVKYEYGSGSDGGFLFFGIKSCFELPLPNCKGAGEEKINLVLELVEDGVSAGLLCRRYISPQRLVFGLERV